MDHPSVWRWVMAAVSDCVCESVFWSLSVAASNNGEMKLHTGMPCNAVLTRFSFIVIFPLFLLLLLLRMFKCGLDYRFSCFTFYKVLFCVWSSFYLVHSALYLIWFLCF